MLTLMASVLQKPRTLRAGQNHILIMKIGSKYVLSSETQHSTTQMSELEKVNEAHRRLV